LAPRGAKVAGSNVAVTARAWVIVTAQVPVPVQTPPLQPVKVEPAVAVAVKVTAVPGGGDTGHVAPQLMPAGVLVTVPLPAPALVTLRAKVCGSNVAVTARGRGIVAGQGAGGVQDAARSAGGV